MSFFDNGAARALNHLLEREAWAREKLAPFAGEVVEIRCDPLPPLRLVVAEGGRALPAEQASAPTLVISGGPGMLAALSAGPEHYMRAVEISGNAQLASEILVLLRHLRWDVEEDLSRVFGDVLAHRIVGGAREFAHWHVQAAQRLGENIVEYAVEEREMIVSRPEFDIFAAEVARLRDDLARLESRIERQSRGADRDAH